jgi:hypothetical protein
MNNVKAVLKIILLLIAVGIVIFILYSCIQNTSSCRSGGGNSTAPAVYEAPWKATVMSTGNIYYAKEIVTVGDVVGSRVYTLRNIWEFGKDSYIHKDIIVVLDEATFGEIIIERR